MTQRQRSTSGSGAPGAGDWWSRRPRRSATDRKIAGVAGGLGRAMGVDPVLIRVGFVVLALFGAGLLLYLLAWLLLPADGDETSPAESLIGRGRSSTPPILAAGLAIVAAIMLTSALSWGRFSFWPLVVAGVIAIMVIKHNARNGSCARHGGSDWQHGGPRARGEDPWGGEGPGGAGPSWHGPRGHQGPSWGEHAEAWVARQPWSGQPSAGDGRPDSSRATSGDPTQARSPFDEPAFWERTEATPGTPSDGVNLNKDQVNLNKNPQDGDPTNGDPSSPTADRRKPPEWDPLGAAPFAWDLPEPSPAPAATPTRPRRGIVGRVTMGAALLVGGLATAGVFAGWWHPSWAVISASVLAVVAIGLLIGSLRGRGHGLIGPGIFLSVLTIGLTITGITGTDGYGQQTWQPATPAAVQAEYVLNGGQGVVDLSAITVPKGQVVSSDVVVRAGQASVIVPADANVDVTCSANAGEVSCLGLTQDGLNREITTQQTGSPDAGRLALNVHVGAGQAEVRHG